MSQPTVVNLKRRDKSAVRVPPIVHTVRQHARRTLTNLLQTLFNSTDDALFELADRSQSNNEQTLFFESMRQIRLRRKDVLEQFGRNLYAGFDELFTNSGTAAEELEIDDPDNLSLVANDELEITVAVAGIVSKVTSTHSLVIMQLTKRLDHICKLQSVTDRANPLGPQKLSMAFVQAAQCLDLDIKVMIILLKLFERMVMERLDDLYLQANELMIEAGVMPDLQRNMRQKAAKRAAPAAQANADAPVPGGVLSAAMNDSGATPVHPGTGVASATAPSFGVLQQLLAGAGMGTGTGAGMATGGAGGGSATGAGYVGTPGANSGYGSGGVVDGPGASGGFGPAMGGAAGTSSAAGIGGGIAISTPQLVNLLSNLQSEADIDAIDPGEPAPLLDLRNMVFTQAKQELGEDDKHIEQNDDDVINIVGMLFDYILNDRNLAIPMKALISRLQIPFVKLAILDKSFFDKTSHPARQLLNELSSAGIGWSSASELKRDARYNKIESIVLRVLNGFTDDVEIFEPLVEDLRDFLNQEEKRHVQIEERVQQAETGKAKTQAAKQEVQQLINRKASGLRLPAQIGRFISDSFAKALVITGVKHGESSGEWHMNIQTLDELLWCCQPLSSKEDVKKRNAQLPGLLKRLRGIVNSIQEDDSAAEELVFNLECELNDAAARDMAYLDSEDPVPAEVPENYAQVAEVHLVEVAEQDEQFAQAAPQFLEKLHELKEGGWVELRGAEQAPVRCKLSTIVQPGDRYVFVNRRGMKVADYGRMELARRLEDSELTLLDESEVFDRALQAVVGNLRQMQTQPETVKLDSND
ncbi:MAG: DUF1631 domain-containing protein [Pseudomonadales bacterium]